MSSLANADVSPAVIFDIDGTLLASNAVDDASFVDAIGDVLGIAVADTDWANYAYSTDQGLLDEIVVRGRGERPRDEEVLAVKRRFVALLDERIGARPELCRPMPGALAMLERLRGELPGRIGLASGAWPESAAVKLRHAGVGVSDLPGTFSHADEDATPVSRPRIVGLTMRKLGAESKSRVVYVGDGVWDALAARELGIGFVGVATGEKRERLMGRGVSRERIIADFADVDSAVALICAEA